MRKARATYIGRQQEYEKLRAEAVKAETESVGLSAQGGVAGAKADARVEKKKKMEDEAMQKVELLSLMRDKKWYIVYIIL